MANAHAPIYLNLKGYQKDSNFRVICWNESCIFRTTNATFSCRILLNSTNLHDNPTSYGGAIL